MAEVIQPLPLSSPPQHPTSPNLPNVEIEDVPSSISTQPPSVSMDVSFDDESSMMTLVPEVCLLYIDLKAFTDDY